MVYVIAELRNYRQLARLRAGSLPAIEAGLAALLGSRGQTLETVRPGAWMAEVGPQKDLDAAAAASAAVRVREYLASRREELFGFSVILAVLAASTAAGRAAVAAEILAEAEGDESLWIAPECAPSFSALFRMERSGSLFSVAGPGLPPVTAAPREDAPRPWVRESLVGRALDIVSFRLNTGESREILMVHGPSGVGKTAVLAEVGARIMRGARQAPLLRMRTIFKRRSPLHPFLSALVPSQIAATPRLLRGPERAVWEEVGALLGWLQGTADDEQSAATGLLPDHILEDFSLGFGLYLLAWTRMAQESLVPSVLLCEGIDSYHPAARRVMARLLEDLLSRQGFLPLFSSAEEKPPDELAGFDIRALYIHPLGKREIRSLAQHMFPGLELPESQARRLRRRSGGLYLSVVSYLQFLGKSGRIRARAGVHEWVPSSDDESVIPANPLSVFWYLMRTLHDDAFPLLYALYLAGGLLDTAEFLSFLAAAGFDVGAAERSLESLRSSGIVTEEGSLIPRFPALRRKVEELLGAEAVTLRGRFVSHVMDLWTGGKYRHPVLLFTFLARSGKTDLALRILPEIIRRKLDEKDTAGARAFCDLRALDFSAPPTVEQSRELAAVAAIGRLRAALLDQDEEAATAAQSEAQRCVAGAVPRGISGSRGALIGGVHIERAKCFLSDGNAASALEELKKGLLVHQEAREENPSEPAAQRGERACYLWLGTTMLADGRMREAVEYFGLSQRLCHESGDAPGSLWTDLCLSTCLFIDGRYTQCFAAIESGLKRARAIYRRETELFLLFLKARTLFQVGSYQECSLSLQGCLCLASVYSIDGALPVLRAWLGRTLLHQGEIVSGTRLLESLPQTREVFLFLAEGSLFSEGLENASLYIERGLAVPAAFRFPSPEVISWRDGFAGIEGRCFRLSRGDAFLRRTLSGLRAYLQGLRGFREEGIAELHQLTRGEKSVEEDPVVYWFNYLYSRVLPESGSEDVDDKVTVLSKSLKTLQQRASRIDAPTERSSFLWRNRWNRMIMEEARERKLV
jgi:tetratricopeptide (TPR) repeat protein